MSQATKLAGAAGDQDPRIGLRSVAALRKLVERLQGPPGREARGPGGGGRGTRARMVVEGDRRRARRQPPGRAQETREGSPPRAEEVAVFERFTTQARSGVTLAQEQARRLGRPNIGTQPLLLGILGTPDTAGVRALEALGVGEPDVH